MVILLHYLFNYDFYQIIDEAEDPAAHPVLWIGKWVDYTDKYGLGNYLYLFVPICFYIK